MVLFPGVVDVKARDYILVGSRSGIEAISVVALVFKERRFFLFMLS